MSKSILFSLLLPLALGCQSPKSNPFQNNTIATAHPLASLAGKAIFAKGGNAFDAAVAAGFTLAVVEQIGRAHV